MINLLPTDIKKDYRYARYNSRLLKWVIGGSIALLGVMLIIGSGWVYLHQSTKNISKQVSTSEQNLQAQNITGTKKQLDEISSNTKLVVQVLSREVLFSKLLRQLGASVPANTVLESFQVDKLQGGLTITASAKDITSATQLQVNLQDPKNKIFEKAEIENINCGGNANKKLSCSVQIRALFNKNSPYFYITQSTGVKP